MGGNSKFYGAVLARYRREDFAEMVHQEGISPAWSFSYEELEPWYSQAETLYKVRDVHSRTLLNPFILGPTTSLRFPTNRLSPKSATALLQTA